MPRPKLSPLQIKAYMALRAKLAKLEAAAKVAKAEIMAGMGSKKSVLVGDVLVERVLTQRAEYTVPAGEVVRLEFAQQ